MSLIPVSLYLTLNWTTLCYSRESSYSMQKNRISGLDEDLTRTNQLFQSHRLRKSGLIVGYAKKIGGIIIDL